MYKNIYIYIYFNNIIYKNVITIYFSQFYITRNLLTNIYAIYKE